MSKLSRLFGQAYEYIKADIFRFCDMMHFTPTWQQAELLECVQRGDKQIAVRSGQGPGKTTVTVVVALWRCLQAENAMTVLTAPTMRQCREVWLAEARKLLPKADPILQRLIDVTQTKIQIAGNPDWGVKTVTANREENAQGFHDPNMTIIGEEGSGIPRKIIEQFEGTASNPNSLFLLIGNPNTRDCYFFDAFHGKKAQWTGLHWNAEETPESAFFTHERNWKLEEQYGRDSDIYRIRVLGEFPKTDPDCVIGSEQLEIVTDIRRMRDAALRRTLDGRFARQFGLDFARKGGDESTMFRRSGEAIVQWDRWAHREPSDAVLEAFKWQKIAGWTNEDCIYVPDATGMGQGVLHMFYDKNKRVLEFHNHGRAADTAKYENRVTEAWFGLRDKVKAGTPYIPNDPMLLQQLTTRRYYMTRKGKLCLESKDEYMDRGHESPDRADGLVMCMYDQIHAVAHLSTAQGGGRTVGTDTVGMRN